MLMVFHFFRCILDGEMLVWDTSTNRFAEFGSNQEIGFLLFRIIFLHCHHLFHYCIFVEILSSYWSCYFLFHSEGSKGGT